ncbi:MAG: hypothetical protein NUV82_04575 [Candidatus Komeilibacteria bacterium]|nr:hypothetical protein [Candidatus Komeilibacteria bacterium]
MNLILFISGLILILLGLLIRGRRLVSEAEADPEMGRAVVIKEQRRLNDWLGNFSIAIGFVNVIFSAVYHLSPSAVWWWVGAITLMTLISLLTSRR